MGARSFNQGLQSFKLCCLKGTSILVGHFGIWHLEISIEFKLKSPEWIMFKVSHSWKSSWLFENNIRKTIFFFDNQGFGLELCWPEGHFLDSGRSFWKSDIFPRWSLFHHLSDSPTLLIIFYHITWTNNNQKHLDWKWLIWKHGLVFILT